MDYNFFQNTIISLLSALKEMYNNIADRNKAKCFFVSNANLKFIFLLYKYNSDGLLIKVFFEV